MRGVGGAQIGNVTFLNEVCVITLKLVQELTTRQSLQASQQKFKLDTAKVLTINQAGSAKKACILVY